MCQLPREQHTLTIEHAAISFLAKMPHSSLLCSQRESGHSSLLAPLRAGGFRERLNL
jgi:hypothetical protein